MKLQGHYYVDVFRADGRFVRGFTLQQEGNSPRYRVVDDAGLMKAPGTMMSEPLPLEEALRRALVETKQYLRVEITPAFGSAPFELLGYVRFRFFRPPQEIGEDGRPGPPFSWKRTLRKGRVLVDLEEDGVGIYSWPQGAWRASLALSWRARRTLFFGASGEKPLGTVRKHGPTWMRDMTFAFDLFFRLLEQAPGGSKVERVRFENPPSGSVFLLADLVPRDGDPAAACAEAAVGNKVEDGRIVVDGRALRFRCDCLVHVDLWMGLPEAGRWLTRSALEQIGAAAAKRHGVEIAE